MLRYSYQKKYLGRSLDRPLDRTMSSNCVFIVKCKTKQFYKLTTTPNPDLSVEAASRQIVDGLSRGNPFGVEVKKVTKVKTDPKEVIGQVCEKIKASGKEISADCWTNVPLNQINKMISEIKKTAESPKQE